VSCVFNRVKMSTVPEQRVVLLGFIALPYSSSSIGMIRVIVVLMNGQNDCGSVNDGHARRPRVPDQPIVPAGAPGEEWRNLAEVQALGKDEIINPLRRTLEVCLQSTGADIRFPIRSREINRGSNLGILAPADHQKILAPGTNPLHSGTEIGEQENVAIHVAEQVVPRGSLGAIEE